MKKFLILLISLILTSNLFALKIKGVNIPEEIEIKGTKCVLNGAGIRKKFFFSIYVGALYLPEKMHDPLKIITLNKPKAVLMVFVYHKISPKKIINAWKEGFEKNYDTEKIKDKLQIFYSYFKNEVHKGDKFLFTYTPFEGTCTYINDKLAGCIKGKEFMNALFSIWLGEKPASKSLKKKMLGE